MEEIVYHTNYILEDSYWWFIARNKIVFSLIDKLCDLNKDDEVLDVGCGTGGFTKHLSEKFKVIGLDTSLIALEYCHKRNLKNLFNTTLEDFPAYNWNIKALTFLDVIEHIENDSNVLKRAYEILHENGYLIATVPAYQWLWSGHDEVHFHFRRYTKKNINNLLKRNGFKIIYSSYINFFLFLPAVIKRFLDKILSIKEKERTPVDEVSPFINKLFTKIYCLENKLIPKITFPFGLSIVVIARK